MLLDRVRKRIGGSDSDGPVLRRTAQFCLDHRRIVIGGWLLLAVLLTVLLPQLESVAREQSTDPIPADVRSFQALDAMGEAFAEPGAAATVFVVMSNPGGLSADRSRYDRFVQRMRDDDVNVQSVRDLAADPVGSQQAISADGRAWYLPLGLNGRFGSTDTAEAVESVRAAADQIFAGSSTQVHVTGPSATFADQIRTAESELLLISIATLILIGIILLIVYRSVLTALLPLLVIGVSLAVARGVLSGLGLVGLPVSEYSIAFLTAILLGAGTDYSVFVIARYHECIRAGEAPEDAVVSATASIGRVVIASAMTVTLALLAMVFADLSVFTTVGPACAIAILVSLAASLTLLQPILAIAARRGYGLPGRELTARHWRRVGATVVRRPRAMLAVSLTALLACSLPLLGMHLNFDDRGGQPPGTDSNRGYALLDAHFPKDITVSEFVLITSPRDMRTATALADLDQLAFRIAQLPGVTRVIGVTRPTGDKLGQAQLSWQNGEIGRTLTGAVSEGQGRSSELSMLRDGAHQLAGALGQLRERVDAEVVPLAQTLGEAVGTVQSLRDYRPYLDTLTAIAPGVDAVAGRAPEAAHAARAAERALHGLEPALSALDAPYCLQIAACEQLRTQLADLTDLGRDGFFTDVAALAGQLRSGNTSVTALTAQLNQAVGRLDAGLSAVDGVDIAGAVEELSSGVSLLADGANQLAAGVDALVDTTMETLVGMGQVATALRTSAAETAGSNAATGFYLPADAFENQDFAAVARQFISPDGHAIRYAVQTDVDPYSHAAIELSSRIADVVAESLPNTELSDATTYIAGFPAINTDLQRLLASDFRLLAVTTILIVGLILAVLLRSVVAPIYLVATVILNYTAALGLGVLVFEYLLGQPIFWPVPLLAFIILVAVGADYNMLLVARLREESSAGLRVGVLRTVGHTGAVITSAGVIFAASMFGLMAGSVGIMVQAGFVIGVGLLIDTFVVRTLTVPALAALLGRANWWPGPSPAAAASPDRPATADLPATETSGPAG